ncbi:MAG: undecaprenyl-diphosphate phosphatase [Coriobacteriia bacterium]|nr:undecaprenyl-diphosphate phosphatase [Coriobacteriia bacterium]
MSLFGEIIKVIVIGLVEGVTEWLPISSTGHMIIVNEFVELDVSPDFLKLFLVVIQLGAILAVIVLYFKRLNPWDRQKNDRERHDTFDLWAKVIIASVPAAIIGLLFDDWVEEHFFNAFIVALALIVYGFAFIVVERMHGEVKQPLHMRRYRVGDHESDELDKITLMQAIGIGCFQCLAIVPGTSRSGSTILGGRILGVSRRAAAEFSFLLAIPALFGWSLLKIIKTLVIDHLAVKASEWLLLLIGIFVAFMVSLLVIRFLVNYVQKHSFVAFAWYRIALGAVVILYFAFTGGLFA